MMLVIFSRRMRFAFSISVHRSTYRTHLFNSITLFLTFEYLLLLSLDQGVPERIRLMIVDHGARLQYLHLMHSSVVLLPFLIEDPVELGEGSVHMKICECV